MAECKINPQYRQSDEEHAQRATNDELLRWIEAQITKNKAGPQGASQRNYNMLCRREARRRGLTF
jgi:hypothetical protein